MRDTLGALLAVTMLIGCRHGGIESGPLISHRDTLGDTVVVRTVSGSVWGRPIQLHEDLRIGSLEGNGPDAFGEIRRIAVEPDGSILVFDGQVPALRRFSSSGAFLGTIGRKGRGPGEYGGGANGLAVDRSGRIILSDPANARVHAFSSDGSFLRELGPVGGLQSLFGQGVAVDDSGRVYVDVLMTKLGPHMPSPWPIGAEVRDRDGRVLDTIPPPLVGGAPSNFFEVLPDGSIAALQLDQPIVGIHHPDGRVTRVRMPYEGLPYTDRELATLKVGARAAAAADGKSKVSLPERKPVYIDALSDPLGRIWLRRPIAPRSQEEARAVPRFQSSVLDVITEDGTYMGVVELPPRTMPWVVTSTSLYAVQLGEYDEQYVVRYRLALP